MAQPNTPVDDSPHDGVRKRACILCKRRKIKCSGELPSCTRCIQLSHECHYPPRRRLGRPKKLTGLSSVTHLSTASPHVGLQSSVFHGPIGIFPITPDSSSHTYGSPASRNVTVDNVNNGNIDNNESSQQQTTPVCACISILYLALDELRAIRFTQFSSSLASLRAALTSAAEALDCGVCPTRFLSAMQNAHLIGVVMISAAECYSKILQSLTRTDDLGDDNENAYAERLVNLQTLDNNKNSLSADDSSSSTAGLSLTLSLSEREWRHIARKALYREIYFPSTAKTSQGQACNFTHVLDGLVTRQIACHSTQPPLDAPVTFRPAWSPDTPACLLVAEEARRLIDSLDFG